MNHYYLISNLNDINYKSILTDYRKNFAGKVCTLRTNYKPLSEFQVTFNERDLPHLIGWQKVLHHSNSASNIINMVDTDTFTFSSSKKSKEFFRIKDRLLSYNFLHSIFIQQKPDICVMTRGMKPNPLRLDIVFYDFDDPTRITVLGLRKKKGMDSFVPTTLHKEKVKNSPYPYRRKTKIINLEWG